jgi:hypothetical protein
MKIKAITTEQFVEIYELLTDKIEHSPNSSIKVYSGMLKGTGKVVITSDPIQCLLYI